MQHNANNCKTKRVETNKCAELIMARHKLLKTTQAKWNPKR